MRGGKAMVKPLKIAVAGGSLEGALSLDSNQKPSVAAADIKMRNVDLKAFFKGSQFFETTEGKIGADLDISGQGKSLAEVMGSSDGKTFFTMTGGALSGLLIEAAGLDIAEALVLYIGDDARVPIRCAAGPINLAKGVAKFDRIIMDTTNSVLYIRGESNLRKELLMMDIFADAKDFSVLDMDAPVHLEGKIRAPEISIGKGVPIPIIEPGDAEDVNCERCWRQALDAVALQDGARPPATPGLLAQEREQAGDRDQADADDRRQVGELAEEDRADQERPDHLAVLRRRHLVGGRGAGGEDQAELRRSGEAARDGEVR